MPAPAFRLFYRFRLTLGKFFLMLGFRRRTAIAGVAVTALSMSLAGTIALGQAAPAQALAGDKIAADAVMKILGTGFNMAGMQQVGTMFTPGSPQGEPAPSLLEDWLGINLWSPSDVGIPDFWTVVPSPPSLWEKDKDPVTNEPVDTLKQKPEVPSVATWSASAPENPSHGWSDASIHIDNFRYVKADDAWKYTYRWATAATDAYRNKVRSANFHQTVKCKSSSGAYKTLKEVVVSGPMVQTAGNLSSNGIIYNPCIARDGWSVQSIKIRPATTAEKMTKMGTNVNSYSFQEGYWAAEDIFWMSKDHTPEDPRYSAEVTCKNPAGGENVTISGYISYPSDSLNIPSCAAAGLGAPVGLDVGFADTETKEAPIFTYTQTDDPMLNCDPAFGAPCKMEVYIDGMPCSVGNQACMSWSGLYRVASYRVECRYGGKVVDISGCALLEGAYVPGGTPAVAPNIDGDPDTWTNPFEYPGWTPQKETPTGPQDDEGWKIGWTPQPDPTPAPDITTDPELPPEPEPSTPPTPQPSSSPSSSPSPSSEPSSSAEPSDPAVDPETPTDPDIPNPDGGKDDSCGYEWKWDPWSWVGAQLNCAFVPKTDIKDRITTTKDIVLTKPPISWFSVGDIQGPSSSGCPNWVVTVGNFSKNVVCDSPFIHQLVGIRTPLFNLVAAAMVFPLIRSIWYSLIPILRVSPSSGGTK